MAIVGTSRIASWSSLNVAVAVATCDIDLVVVDGTTGVPSVVAEAGWDVTVETTTDENTGFQKTTVTGVKSLPMA